MGRFLKPHSFYCAPSAEVDIGPRMRGAQGIPYSSEGRTGAHSIVIGIGGNVNALTPKSFAACLTCLEGGTLAASAIRLRWKWSRSLMT